MFEKVNPSHPDKLADRIAGALVDMAYSKEVDPRIAVEVLLGHGECNITAETSVQLEYEAVRAAALRIVGVGDMDVRYLETKQDRHLAENQREMISCGDNGIFKGAPVTYEQHRLLLAAHFIYGMFPFDGKYIIADKRMVICQSNADRELLASFFPSAEINPIGDWTGGVSVDSGATNRKLGSDMGDSVTGGGLHGKDLSKADVSVNIFAWHMAKKLNRTVEMHCAIGDRSIDGIPYSVIVEFARNYIEHLGGFEKFAEWGLIR